MKARSVFGTWIKKALVFGVLVSFARFAWAGSFDCAGEYKTLETELKNANFCAEDSDCKVLDTAGYIKFGCYRYVNKSVDTDALLKKMETYSMTCSQAINDCDTAPPAKCLERKCVSKKQGLGLKSD